jgi:hypothetical protein
VETFTAPASAAWAAVAVSYKATTEAVVAASHAWTGASSMTVGGLVREKAATTLAGLEVLHARKVTPCLNDMGVAEKAWATACEGCDVHVAHDLRLPEGKG